MVEEKENENGLLFDLVNQRVALDLSEIPRFGEPQRWWVRERASAETNVLVLAMDADRGREWARVVDELQALDREIMISKGWEEDEEAEALYASRERAEAWLREMEADGEGTIVYLRPGIPVRVDWLAAGPVCWIAPGRHPLFACSPGSIYVFGDGTCETYDPMADTWRFLKETPRGIVPDEPSCVFVEGQGRGIYLTGRGTRLVRFDPAKEEWHGLWLRDAQEEQAKIVAVGHELVFCGGKSGARDATEVFDTETERWTRLGGLRVPRYGHAAVALPDGTVLALGGRARFRFGGSPPLQNVEALGPGRGDWIVLSSPSRSRIRIAMPEPLTDHAALVVGSRLFVLGGRTLFGHVLRDVRYLDESGPWVYLPPMPLPLFGLACVCLDDVLFVIGGRDADNVARAEVYFYDLAKGLRGKWRACASLSHPRAFHTACLVPSSSSSSFACICRP